MRCQGTVDFGDAENTRNSMLPAASETNVVVIAMVAVGVEPAPLHSVFCGVFPTEFVELVLLLLKKAKKNLTVCWVFSQELLPWYQREAIKRN